MKVADLQQFLNGIVPFALAAGASDKVSTELSRVVEALAPFKGKTLAEFNDFLRKAEEFDRTGVLAVPKKAPKAAKAPKLSVEEAAAKFTTLHERATDPALEYATIESEIDLLEGLTAANLKEVAKKVNVTMPGKATKPQILSEFKRRIKERKGSFERTQFRTEESSAN